MFRIVLSGLVSLWLLMGSAMAWAEPVNINTADATTLSRVIKGVGIKKAEAIVAYRDTNGPFKSVDELAKVKGIGVATVEKSRPNLTTK